MWGVWQVGQVAGRTHVLFLGYEASKRAGFLVVCVWRGLRAWCNLTRTQAAVSWTSLDVF